MPGCAPRTQSRAPALTPEQVLHAWPRIQAVCDAARAERAARAEWAAQKEQKEQAPAAAAPVSPGTASFEEVASGVAVDDELGRLQLRRTLSELSELLPAEAALAEPRGAATVHALLQSVGAEMLARLAQACNPPRASTSLQP